MKKTNKNCKTVMKEIKRPKSMERESMFMDQKTQYCHNVFFLT